MRAWALRYIAKIRDPEVAWEDIESKRVRVLRRDEIVRNPKRECTPKQKSASLGKAMHSVFETWYDGGDPNWYNLPGQIAESGRHLLPAPDQCLVVLPEEPIGITKLVVTPEDVALGKPSVALDVGGILFAGYKDLRVCITRRERDRLGLSGLGAFDGGWLLCDYKSTRDIFEYTKTPEDLFDDLQACLYTVDCTRITGHTTQACRWVYFETQQVRRALPVDTVIPRDHALEVVAHATRLARELDQIETVEQAPANLEACELYGGCRHHASKGGTCKVRRRIGALVQLTTKGKNEMAMTEEQKAEMRAKIEAQRAALAAGKAPTVAKPSKPATETAEVIGTDVTDAGELPSEPPPAPPPAKSARAPRKPAASAPSAPPAEAPPPPAEVKADVATVLALHEELAKAQAEKDVCDSEHDLAREAFDVAVAAKLAADTNVAAVLAKMRGALG